MTWGNEEWGLVLIIVGILFLLGAISLSGLMSIVGIEMPGLSVSVGGISPQSAVSLAVGVVCLYFGVKLRRQ